MKGNLSTAITSTLLGLVSTLGLGLSRADAAILVGNTRGNNVVVFSDTGEFRGSFIAPGSGGLIDPDDLTFGPDGNLYVSSGSNSGGQILRFNGQTGAFIDVFATGTTANPLVRPYGNAFGPDGYLYVSSFLTDEILRFDAVTGAFVDVFASAAGIPGASRLPGQLNGPNDLLFLPGGKLLVSTQGSVAVPGSTPGTFSPDFSFGLPSQVLIYDIATGTSQVLIDQPTPPADSPFGGFVSFLGLSLGPNGDLFVSDFANDITRYSLSLGSTPTATLIDTLSANYTTTFPIDRNNFLGNFAFSPGGTLYAAAFDFTQGNIGTILRYNSITGDPLPTAGNPGAAFVLNNPSLQRPIGVTYLETVPEPGVVGGLAAIGLLGLGARRRKRLAN